MPLAEALPRLAQPNGLLLQFAPSEGGVRRLIAIRAVAPGGSGQPVAAAEGVPPPNLRKTPVSQRDPRRGLPAGLWDYDKGEENLPDVDKRIALLGEIARTRGQAATAAITYVLIADPDPRTRIAAIGLLTGQQSSPEGKQALIQAVADTDPSVRTEALRALSRDGRDKPVALLAQVIKGDADRQVRLAAIETLNGGDGDLARAVLQGALIDQDAELREAAKQAMARR